MHLKCTLVQKSPKKEAFLNVVATTLVRLWTYSSWSQVNCMGKSYRDVLAPRLGRTESVRPHQRRISVYELKITSRSGPLAGWQWEPQASRAQRPLKGSGGFLIDPLFSLDSVGADQPTTKNLEMRSFRQNAVSSCVGGFSREAERGNSPKDRPTGKSICKVVKNVPYRAVYSDFQLLSKQREIRMKSVNYR